MRDISYSIDVLSTLICSKFINYTKDEEASTDANIVLTGASSITRTKVLHECLLKRGFKSSSPEFNRGFTQYEYIDHLGKVKVLLDVRDNFTNIITITKVTEV